MSHGTIGPLRHAIQQELPVHPKPTLSQQITRRIDERATLLAQETDDEYVDYESEIDPFWMDRSVPWSF